ASLDTLSARDRAIATALEPVVMIDPPDWAETDNRLRVLRSAAPADMGIQKLLVTMLVLSDLGPAGLAEASMLAESATTADPRDGYLWSDRVALAVMQGRGDEANDLGQKCLRAAPRS